jgi:hypothetical protein
MENFDDIEKQLDGIIATSCRIIEVEEKEERIEAIKQLMAKREKQLQTLYQAKIDKYQLTEEQRDKFRHFFTRFYVLDKKMNRFFTELSLHCRSSIQEFEDHKKAKKAYVADTPTSTLLNAQLSG